MLQAEKIQDTFYKDTCNQVLYDICISRQVDNYNMAFPKLRHTAYPLYIAIPVVTGCKLLTWIVSQHWGAIMTPNIA